jgi:alpha-beta hydrolase superfamily lysophospholipase
LEANQQSRSTRDGARLWTREWRPEGVTRGTVVLVHGLGEHSGRYSWMAERLATAGHVVLAFDLRGHGRSSGRRGDTRLEAAQDDVERVLASARAERAGRPVFLYGHSLGALIVLALLASRRPFVDGAIVSAPPLRNALREQRLKIRLTRTLGALLPGLALPAGIDAAALSRDPAVVEAYRADPLVHNRAGLGFALDALAATALLEQVTRLPRPLLILHGGADRIAFPEGSRELCARLSSEVTLREYPGLFHEPHHEPEREAVLEDVLGWIAAHLRP